jgi:hypothetical protein
MQNKASAQLSFLKGAAILTSRDRDLLDLLQGIEQKKPEVMEMDTE